MWYYDEHGNFVGDEDRPSEDDMGFILDWRDEANMTREKNAIVHALENAHECKCTRHAWAPDCPAHPPIREAT
jgi:hypothetical protein